MSKEYKKDKNSKHFGDMIISTTHYLQQALFNFWCDLSFNIVSVILTWCHSQ